VSRAWRDIVRGLGLVLGLGATFWLVAIVLIAAFVPNASAHPVSVQECSEGGEFIGNAARSRDAGMTREAFLERFEHDVVMLEALPSEYRWFIQDEADAQYLREAIQEVFDAPKAPITHEMEFISRCITSPPGSV
jgi:hypothetical protein